MWYKVVSSFNKSIVCFLPYATARRTADYKITERLSAESTLLSKSAHRIFRSSILGSSGTAIVSYSIFGPFFSYTHGTGFLCHGRQSVYPTGIADAISFIISVNNYLISIVHNFSFPHICSELILFLRPNLFIILNIFTQDPNVILVKGVLYFRNVAKNGIRASKNAIITQNWFEPQWIVKYE